METFASGLLGDLVELKRGYDLPKQNRVAGDVPIVSSSGIADYHNASMVKAPGVVTGRYGTLGKVFYLTDDFWPLNTSLYVRDFKNNDPRFVSYFLKTLDFYAYSDKAAVPGLNRNDLHVAPIVYPNDINQQRQIADLLGALDDKIDLNLQISQTLEMMSQAIFKNWLSGLPNLPRVTVAKLAKAGVMAIGDGYRAKNEELFGPGLPFIRAGELNNGFDTSGADTLNEVSVAIAGDKCSRTGDVAFTSKGTIGRFARVTEETPDFVYSPQVCFWRSLNPQILRPSILYAWMVGDELKAQIDAVSGQTDMALYVSLKDQRQMTLPVLPGDQHAVADKLDSLLDLQSHNEAENRTLSSIRDLLLPKLMSGEIRIREAEAMVAAAA